MTGADEAVERFVFALHDCRRALRHVSVGVFRDGPTEPLRLVREEGEPGVRSGRLAGLGSFSLHGYGCRVELDNGGEVDWDWDQQGREEFDGWRLRQFARSTDADPSLDDLLAAARSRADLVEVRTGVFVLAVEGG